MTCRRRWTEQELESTSIGLDVGLQKLILAPRGPPFIWERTFLLGRNRKLAAADWNLCIAFPADHIKMSCVALALSCFRSAFLTGFSFETSVQFDLSPCSQLKWCFLYRLLTLAIWNISQAFRWRVAWSSFEPSVLFFFFYPFLFTLLGNLYLIEQLLCQGVWL